MRKEKKQSLWQKINEPFWTPIGVMGLIACFISIGLDGWESLFFTFIVFIAIVCWAIREL
jgi:hypothetical protein